MSLEVILWLIAWFVVSEIIFIIGEIFNFKYGDNIDNKYFAREDWIGWKILSFLIGSLLVFTQFVIVLDYNQQGYLHYSRLIWELVIIGSIAILFGLNKLIVILVEYIDKNQNEKKQSRK